MKKYYKSSYYKMIKVYKKFWYKKYIKEFND